MSAKNLKSLKLSDIKIDSEVQSRQSINQEAVEEYARNIDLLPPGIAFFDGESNWLARGFHRYFAHAHARKKEMKLEIRKGTREDAIIFSAGENADNGVHRSHEDKRKAVLMLLKLQQFTKKSNNVIAAAAKVSKDLVARIRADATPADQQPAETEGKDGVVRPTAPNKKRGAAVKAKKNADKAAEASQADSEGKTPEKAAPEPPAAPPEPAKVETGRDEKPIKREATQILFGQDERFKAVKASAAALKKQLLELAGEKVGNFMEENDINDRIQAIYNLIEFSRPFAECPYCVSNPKAGCKVCHRTGFITKPVYDNLPQEIKDGKYPAEVKEEKEKPADPADRKRFRLGEKGRSLYISQARADEMNADNKAKGITDVWHEVAETDGEGE